MKIRRASTLVLLGLLDLACSTAGAADAGSPSPDSATPSPDPGVSDPAAMPPATAEPQVVRVGYAHSLTGPSTKLGANFERTVRLAEQQINSNGGIRGKMLELVTKDTQGSGDGATSIAQELVSSGISAIITDDGTAPGLAMLGVTVPANAVLVFGSAQAIALSKPDNNGLFFRPGSNTFDEAGPLTAAIVADGHARIAVLSSTVAYATTLYAEVEKTFLASTCAGAACEIAHHATYPSDADFATFDFAPLITEALASNPDALFVSAFPTDAKVLLPAIWAAGYRGPIYASAAPNNGSLAPSLEAEQAEQIKWAAVQGASGPSIEFVSKLWADAGHAAIDFAGPVLSNYDAMFLLGLALAHANSSDGKVIAESMRAVANAPGEPIYAGDWAKALAAIESGRDIDYVGVTSDVNFDALGNNDKIVTVIKTYRNGEPVVVASE